MSELNEQEIRADERARMADLLDEHAELFGGFATDAVKAVQLVALMLRLKQTADAPSGYVEIDTSDDGSAAGGIMAERRCADCDSDSITDGSCNVCGESAR